MQNKPYMIIYGSYMIMFGIFVDHIWTIYEYIWTIYDHMWAMYDHTWTTARLLDHSNDVLLVDSSRDEFASLCKLRWRFFTHFLLLF